MKAYVVSDREGYSEWIVVVFAESRGKAIVAALGTDEFQFGDWSYTELRAIRKPEFDKYYRGNFRMDWDDQNDRLAMVRDGGYYCNEAAFYPDDCAKCCSKDYCSRYEEYLDEEVKEQEAQRDYEASVDMAEYCERYEQTYNPEDGSM